MSKEPDSTADTSENDYTAFDPMTLDDNSDANSFLEGNELSDKSDDNASAPDKGIDPEPPDLDSGQDGLYDVLARKFSAPDSDDDDAPEKAQDGHEDAPDGSDEPELPKGASKATREHWDALKAKHQEQVSKYETQIAELKKKTEIIGDGDPDDVQAKLERYDKLEKRIAELDLESSPEFQDRFDRPKQAAVEEMNKILERNKQGMTAEELLKLSEEDREDEVSSIIDNLRSLPRENFLNAYRAAEKLSKERADALETAKETSAALQRKAQADGLRAMKEARDSIFKENDAFFTPLEVSKNATDEEKQIANSYNDSLKSLNSNVEKYANAKTPEEVAKASTKAAICDHLIGQTLPRLGETFSGMQKQIKAMEDTIRKLGGASPRGSERSKKKDQGARDYSSFDPMTTEPEGMSDFLEKSMS